MCDQLVYTNICAKPGMLFDCEARKTKNKTVGYGCLGNQCVPPGTAVFLQAPALQIPAVLLQEQFSSEQGCSIQSCPSRNQQKYLQRFLDK